MGKVFWVTAVHTPHKEVTASTRTRHTSERQTRTRHSPKEKSATSKSWRFEETLIFAFLLKLQLKIAIGLKFTSFGHSHLFFIVPRDVKTSDVQKLLLGSPRNSRVLHLHCPELANEHVCTTEQHIKA